MFDIKKNFVNFWFGQNFALFLHYEVALGCLSHQPALKLVLVSS